MSKLILIAVLSAFINFVATDAGGAEIFLNIPVIPGENPTPGFPGAIATDFLNIALPSVSVAKFVDKASPKLVQAVINGTNLGTVQALLYNSSSPSGPPDAILPLTNTIASSVASLGGMPPRESLTMNVTAPQSIYLELPGINGPASTPGHPGVMPIHSLAISGNSLTVVKNVDSASPGILAEILAGMPAFDASLLFYNSSVPGGAPDTVVMFSQALGTSSVLLPGGDVPKERNSFNFVSVSQPVPEPGTLSLIGSLVFFVAMRQQPSCDLLRNRKNLSQSFEPRRRM